MSGINENDDGSWTYNGRIYSSWGLAQSDKEADERRMFHYYNDSWNRSKNVKGAEAGGGCLSAIVLIFLIADSGFNFKKFFLIIAAIVIFILIICLLTKKSKTKNLATKEMWQLYSQGRYSEAISKAKPYGEKNVSAAILLSYAYFFGLGCNKDFRQALHYAAIGKKSSKDSQAIYGMILYHGIDCIRDPITGKNELLSAMTKGSDIALLRYNEILVIEDNANAQVVENLIKAGEKDQIYAYYLLCIIYLNGNGEIEKNAERGLEYMKKAANLGVEDAIDFFEET